MFFEKGLADFGRGSLFGVSRAHRGSPCDMASLASPSFSMCRLAVKELAGDSRGGWTDNGEKAKGTKRKREILWLGEREEKRLLKMSDIIWHYCYLMGGTSAFSAGGIRTNTAAAVCPNLYPQLFLPRRSPPTLPDNPPPTLS